MKNLVLFGFMGTGKSLISKKLAGALKFKAVEMDKIIEQRESKTINRIFEENGEPYFRKLEKDLVEELSAQSDLIISTGGGVVIDEENIMNFMKNGVCICLTATPETIYNRIKHHTHRPLLNTPDPIQTINILLEKRKVFYDKIPYKIQTDNKSPDRICGEALDIYYRQTRNL